MDASGLGRMLIIGGLLVAGLGLVLLLGGRLPFVGRLPGDIAVRWEGGGLYFPIMTCLLISVVLTSGLNLIQRSFGR